MGRDACSGISQCLTHASTAIGLSVEYASKFDYWFGRCSAPCVSPANHCVAFVCFVHVLSLEVPALELNLDPSLTLILVDSSNIRVGFPAFRSLGKPHALCSLGEVLAESRGYQS